MGDEVKITVIATGFRKEMPERRERMLSSALHPEALAPRIESRPPTPRFASEETEPPQPRIVPQVPILVPVSSANSSPPSAFTIPKPPSPKWLNRRTLTIQTTTLNPPWSRLAPPIRRKTPPPNAHPL